MDNAVCLESDIVKLKMAVTKENRALKINNKELTGSELAKKLLEEAEEVERAIKNYRDKKSLLNLLEIVRETYDVIQICIVILWRCNLKADYLDYPDMLEAENRIHLRKLKKRRWEFEKDIEIEVKG